MSAHGLQHLDVHPQNILVHERRLLFTDFGLSMHESFDLDQDERAFFARHGDYDRDAGVAGLLHWALAEVGMVPRADRMAALRAAAASPGAEELDLIRARLDGAAEHAEQTLAVTEMFQLLIADATAADHAAPR